MSTPMPETGSQPQEDTTATVAPKQGRGGLEGLVVPTTTISKVEEKTGQLLYRTYNIHDLASTATFEEVAHLLWFGHLPGQAELSQLKTQLVTERTLPATVVQLLRDLPSTIEPVDALRAPVSLWGAIAIKGKPTLEQPIAITPRFPPLPAPFPRLPPVPQPLEPTSQL